MSRNNKVDYEKDEDNVAPRKGCVSRNRLINRLPRFHLVAPRKGCVSRNNVFTIFIE